MTRATRRTKSQGASPGLPPERWQARSLPFGQIRRGLAFATFAIVVIGARRALDWPDAGSAERLYLVGTIAILIAIVGALALSFRWWASRDVTTVSFDGPWLLFTKRGRISRHRLMQGSLYVARWTPESNTSSAGSVVYARLEDDRIVVLAIPAMLPEDSYAFDTAEGVDLSVESGVEASLLLERLRPFVMPRARVLTAAAPSEPDRVATCRIPLLPATRTHWAVLPSLIATIFLFIALASYFDGIVARTLIGGGATAIIGGLFIIMFLSSWPSKRARKCLYIVGNTVALGSGRSGKLMATAQVAALEAAPFTFHRDPEPYYGDCPGIWLRFPAGIEVTVGTTDFDDDDWWGRPMPNGGFGSPDYEIGEAELARLADTLGLPRR